MAPFFLDIWMELASEEQEFKAVKAEKKTLFFIPANDDIVASARPAPERSISEA